MGRTTPAHQVAWSVYYGERANGLIDHINGDKGDNRICNLRIATNRQNSMNRSGAKDAASPYRGVYPMPNGRWRARISDGVKTLSLGMFDTEVEAAMAFNDAATQLHGEWARLNEV